MNGFFKVPVPVNEPVLNYAPGSAERKALKNALEEARSKQLDIPMYIGGNEVRSGNTMDIRPPHDHQHVLGMGGFNLGTTCGYFLKGCRINSRSVPRKIKCCHYVGSEQKCLPS